MLNFWYVVVGLWFFILRVALMINYVQKTQAGYVLKEKSWKNLSLSNPFFLSELIYFTKLKKHNLFLHKHGKISAFLQFMHVFG